MGLALGLAVGLDVGLSVGLIVGTGVGEVDGSGGINIPGTSSSANLRLCEVGLLVPGNVTLY